LHRLAARGISVLVSTHYMDEAERCHKLAYISNGALLAQGSAAEVIDAQHLCTWTIEGEGLTALSEQLKTMPGVDQTVVFGSALHVSGTDRAALAATLDKLEKGGAEPGQRPLRIAPIATGLEDVFIYLMTRTSDNDADPRGRQP